MVTNRTSWTRWPTRPLLFPPSSPVLSKLLETEEDEEEEGVQLGDTWRLAKPPMAARCWSNVFPMTLGSKQKSANLTFSVAALKRNFKKTPESSITYYLSFDALIFLSPGNQIQALEPYHLQYVQLPHNCAAPQRDADQTLSLTYAKSLTSNVVIYQAHGSLCVEVRPVWRSSAWIFLSPALVTRLHIFFISPHMFLVTVFFVR